MECLVFKHTALKFKLSIPSQSRRRWLVGLWIKSLVFLFDAVGWLFVILLALNDRDGNGR